MGNWGNLTCNYWLGAMAENGRAKNNPRKVRRFEALTGDSGSNILGFG